jgi:hypothetical protein
VKKLTLIAAGIALIIVLSGFAPIPTRVMIDFDPGTTLEQAETWLATLDTMQANVDWHLPVSTGEWYRSGVQHPPSQDYQAYYAEQWQGYINFLKTEVPGHAKQTAGRQAALVKASSIGECWTTQTCPALTVDQADVFFASAAQANSITYPAFAHPRPGGTRVPVGQFFFHLIGAFWHQLASM